MATLKIYNDIVGEEEKIMLQYWEGIDGVCFKDIDEFINSMEKDDKDIDIRIHCKGGDCIEGWAIFDKLRRSDKTITCTVEGECSSMATIILLAAPIERRFAYKNAHFCIHNPAIIYPELDYATRLTADALDRNIDQLKVQAQSLREEQQKILNLYVDRTNATQEDLQALMDKDTYINTDKAMELGFIGKILSPLTASKSRTFKISNPKTMNKNNVTVEKNMFQRLLAKAGLKSISDLAEMKDMVVTAADGTEFTVEREEGDPQVGDAASPDGNYILEDGTEIVVSDGIITSIIPADDEEASAQAANEMDEEELIQKVENLEEEVEQLQTENDELKEEINAYKSKGGRILSGNEKVILAKVNKAGGLNWLNEVLKSSSSFTSQGRRFRESGASNRNTKESSTQKAIREQKAAAEAKRQARRNNK